MLPRDYNGMILHLYRQSDSSMFSAASLKSAVHSDRKTYTVFGYYDRLCFTPVSNFNGYLKSSGSAYQWIGGQKDIMLYPIVCDEYQDRPFSLKKETSSESNDIYSLRINNSDNSRRFIAVTMFYLSDKAKGTMMSYQNLLSTCKKKIAQIVKVYNGTARLEKPILFDVYGSLGTADVAVLWAADQFTDIQILVDRIRYFTLTIVPEAKKSSLFSSSYSVIFLQDSNYNELKHAKLKGGALIQLTTGTVRNKDIVPNHSQTLSYLRKILNNANVEHKPNSVSKVYSCSGEKDYILQTRPPQLKLFSDCKHNSEMPSTDNGQNVNHEIFDRRFSNSSTLLYYEDSDIPEELRDFHWDEYLEIQVQKEEQSKYSSNFWQEEREPVSDLEEFNNYKQILLDYSNPFSSVLTTVKLLYGDFKHAVNITPNQQWAMDLKLQVETVFHLLAEMCKSAHEQPDVGQNHSVELNQAYIEYLNDLLQLLRKQIHHITETGSFSLEVPILHTESTSEYDLLLHMYYGIVKEILATIYEFGGKPCLASQSTLIPLIHFEPAPTLRSFLHFDDDRIEKRLVDLCIPYDAWGEPNLYLLYLIHEIYHYAAPYNRNMRNEYFAKFLIVEMVVDAIYAGIKKSNKISSSATTSAECEKISNTTIHVTNQNHAFVYTMPILREKLFEELLKKNITDNCHRMFLGENKGVSKEDAGDTPPLQNDLSWSTYYALLLSWCDGETDTSQTECNSFLNFVKPLLKGAIKNTKSLLQDEKKSSPEYTCVIDTLNDIIDETTDFQEALKSANNGWVTDLTSQLRELFPDYAMIKLSGITVDQYLLLFSVVQEKLYNSPDNSRADIALVLRIGFIIDFFTNCSNKDFEKCVEDFEKKYHDSFCKLFTYYRSHCYWKSEDKPDESRQSEIHCQTNPEEQWFRYFKNLLCDYYSTYGIYQLYLRQMAIDCFDPILPAEGQKRLQSCTKKFFDSLQSQNLQDLFICNLETVWEFQSQDFLDKLKPKEVSSGSQPNETSKDYKQTVRSDKRTETTLQLDNVTELYSQLSLASKRLQDTHVEAFKRSLPPNGLWYRGSQNSKYEILPSLMVHFLDTKNLSTESNTSGKNAEGNLWQYQRVLLDRFKYRADGAPEFLNGASYTIPDYLAIMQHYQQYTCFLDWSEDAFSALYFSLSSYISEEKDGKVNHDKDDASLYVFDPMLYNRARKIMFESWRKGKKFGKTHSLKRWLFKQNSLILQEPEGYIPNLSAKHQPEKYPMFSMDLPSDFFLDSYRGYYKSSTAAAELTLDDITDSILTLPLAIHTSRLNPRIRTQSGQFLAFSPFTLPAYGKDAGDSHQSDCGSQTTRINKQPNRFSYISLAKIQDYFLDQYSSEWPFMYEIHINKACKEELADFLRISGFTKYRIYPELTNLKL